MSKYKIGKALFWIGFVILIVLLSIKVILSLGTFLGSVFITFVLMLIGGILYIEED